MTIVVCCYQAESTSRVEKVEKSEDKGAAGYTQGGDDRL
jgi:hypothetical protein